MLEDTRFWIEHDTFLPDTIAVRLHHRLIVVHPFPSGNGRWARLMADLVAIRLHRKPFTWGRTSMTDVGDARRA